jgi:glutathione S-transferase
VKLADGTTTTIGETSAILNYVVAAHGGGDGGLARTNVLEAARVAEVMSAFDCLMHKLMPTMEEKDEARRAEMRKQLAEVTFPK